MRRSHCRQVERDESPRAIDALVTAFVTDPCMRWLWPEASDFLRNFPRLIDGFGGAAYAHGAADVTEDFHGAALWLPPGVGPDEEALDALMKTTLAEPARSEVLEVLEQMSASHPAEAHWHLAFIGVDAAHQGTGVGADLMRHRLDMIDAQGVLAYLESSNPQNVPFYRRHGFEVLREIRVGGSPPVTPMVRVPRSR